LKRILWLSACTAMCLSVGAPAFAADTKPKTPPANTPSSTKPAAVKPAPAKPEPATAEPEFKLSIEVPDWLFPIDPNSIHPSANPPKLDDVEQLGIPESTEKYTRARINDPYNAPDWHPNDHIPMPGIVAQGRKPNMMACGYCHTPTGQGRPENSALAGLPEAYLREQLVDFRSGDRKPVGPEAYKPSRGMHKIAENMTDADIEEAAKYFSQQKLGRRVWVIESLRIPRAEPAFWIYEEVGGTEDLDDRMLEVAPDIERHERRDDRMQYNAYVPPGAIARGKRLVTTGDGGKTVTCSQCHLATLKGTDKIPPIAGRSPTYLLRQLLSFKGGGRMNEAGKQMAPVVEKLELNDMIDVVAYLGTLYP
jgi:cytochrome c553